jgi:hypothetical protein
MLKLFSVEEKKGYVDLYYNDLVGLKASFQTFQDLQDKPKITGLLIGKLSQNAW